MKKLFLIGALISSNVLAQAQSPVSIGGPNDLVNALTLTNVKVVNITIRNTSDVSEAYDITVNDKIIDVTKLIPSGASRTIKVPVVISEPNKPEKFYICSTNKPPKGASFKSRVCTIGRFMWVQNDE